MNADGTPGVWTQGRFGVHVPHLGAIAGGILGGGVLVLVAGAATALAGRRRPEGAQPAGTRAVTTR